MLYITVTLQQAYYQFHNYVRIIENLWHIGTAAKYHIFFVIWQNIYIFFTLKM